MSTSPAPVLCLGEALVDLICERPLADGESPDRLVPHFGGTVANVALMCARAGAPTALAGAVGADNWGDWLRSQLSAAGVELGDFHAVPGITTPLVMTTLDENGDASYRIYSPQQELMALGLLGETPGAAGTPGETGCVGAAGDQDAPAPADVARQVAERITAHAGSLFISSNSLVGENSRAISMAVRQCMLERSRPVIFDPNLRLHRWARVETACTVAMACVSDALLVRCNAAEARLLTGEQDLDAAARALLAGGARNVVISCGPDGAIVRGAVDRDCEGVPAQVRSTVGGGDAQMASLLAALVLGDYHEQAIAVSLPAALEAAARACERWGACD